MTARMSTAATPGAFPTPLRRSAHGAGSLQPDAVLPGRQGCHLPGRPVRPERRPVVQGCGQHHGGLHLNTAAPQSRPGGRLPVLVFMHGGVLASGSRGS
jgi:hypothetical protein